MRPHHRLRRAIAAACAAGALAAVALFCTSGSAAAETTGAELSPNGVITTGSPNGTATLSIDAGDTVVFSAPRSAAGSTGVLGYYVKLNTASLPGDASSVKLSGSKSYSVMFPTAGPYSFSWTATDGLGLPIRSSSTNATVFVAAPPSDPTDPSSSDQPPPAQASSGQPSSGQQSSGQPSSAQHSPGRASGSKSTGSTSGILINPFTDGAGSIPFPLSTGFAAPHPDNGTAAGTAPTHRSSVPTGISTGSSSAAQAPAPSLTPPDQTVAASVSTPPTAPPTVLAIASIVALAIVTAFYAHGHLRGKARHAPTGR